MKKYLATLLAAMLILSLVACGGTNSGSSASLDNPTESPTRIFTDSLNRELEIPENIESIVCVNVNALRYTSYMQAQDLVVGVEDYEKVSDISRLYNYVNFDSFSDLPVIGNNGEHYAEAIISANPQVIVMTFLSDGEADALQVKTGIPVVVVPSSDSALDENAYETIRLMGELYGKKDRADELISYMDKIKDDLDTRTADIAEEYKPLVYVGGVSYRGNHGFDGTEANYGPFSLINANNLADKSGQAGAFNIDIEQVLLWDPDYIFVDFNGLDLIKADYAKKPAYYQALTAVEQNKVFSQISFRSYAANLETALANAYYAAGIIYPEQFSDIDFDEKVDEIFRTFLGSNPYSDLKEAGYVFGALSITE